jgi:hypothetical protein
VCLQVITNRYVEYFFIAMIVISSITLCLNTPSLDPESQLYQALKVRGEVYIGTTLSF